MARQESPLNEIFDLEWMGEFKYIIYAIIVVVIIIIVTSLIGLGQVLI